MVHVDLDDFKQVNDTFGHQVGDRALCQLVSVLQRSMRPSDVLCRFGGEEFVLMFPETSLHSATKAVARFLREFSHFFAIILWIAAGLAFFAESRSGGEGMWQLGVAIVATEQVFGGH